MVARFRSPDLYRDPVLATRRRYERSQKGPTVERDALTDQVGHRIRTINEPDRWGSPCRTASSDQQIEYSPTDRPHR